MRIDVYPVGLLRDIQAVSRTYRRADLPPVAREHAWRNIRRSIRRLAALARSGKWRTLKNMLNGYLAEPTPWPEGARRCGSGWTRSRALRSLQRHVRRPGVHWDQTNREIEKMLGIGG